MRIRLAPNERRQQIVEAAMPLFARKGFSGTTTKEIAETAKVSEGLLFKYFASKTALYDAIINHCRDEAPDRFTALENLPPSTATLAETVHHLVFYFATMKERTSSEQSRQRLFMQSLLEDGEFARVGMNAFTDAILPQMARSLEAARLAGDTCAEISPHRTFWLSGLLQMMIGTVVLHDDLKAAATMSPNDWVTETTRFILRGMGVKADAIERAYVPERIVTDPVENDETKRQKKEHLSPAASAA